MSFKSQLEHICTQVEGAVACSLMGFNGLPVETHIVEESGVDVDTLWVELSSVFAQLQRTAQGMSAGEVREVAVHTDRLATVARLVNPEYFVILALRPEGNVGKGRYCLRVQSAPLLAELS